MAYQSKYKGSEVDAKLDQIGESSGDYITFVPQDAATVPNLTLFVDAADNGLKYKDENGTLLSVGLAPA